MEGLEQVRSSERQDRSSHARPPGERPRRGSIAFRDFDLIPSERLLLRKGAPVELGGRAFDLLLVLIRANGNIVQKSTIFENVWPSTMVEESNLRFQMASLRKALGDDRDVIKTIQGRGYLFIAELTQNEDATSGHLAFNPAFSSNIVSDLGATNYKGITEGTSASVAIIDDDDATREALEGFLRSSGLGAECYPSVQAFRERGSDSQAHCLVLDVCMPGETGLELQAELASAGVSVPVIFISGHADVHMSVRAMKAGAVEFLTKPVRHEELLSAIQNAVFHCARAA